ncbi:MAG: hypothetical protein P1V97_36050 [Planctomycetota bacterium]|nr:hypothetical protein [Planctomycetota bacterium]
MRWLPLVTLGLLSLGLLACNSDDSKAIEEKKAKPAIESSKKLYNGQTLSQWFQDIDVTEYKKLENKKFWLDAEKAVNELGPDCTEEIPFLVAELEKKVIRQHGALHCQVALTKIGAPAAGPVSELLRSDNTALKLLAIEVLKRMGTSAAGAILNLEFVYYDDNEIVRNDSRKLLYKLCRGNKPAQEVFIRILDKGPSDQKLYVAKRLAKLKVKSKTLAKIAERTLPTAGPELKKELLTILKANPKN